MPSKKVKITCSLCGKLFLRYPSDTRKAMQNTGYWACKKCTLTKRNVDSQRELWATRIKKQNGRKEIKTRSGWKFLHVHIIESYLGRVIDKLECVHHCDLDKDNNKISNLELMLHSEHTSFHNSGKKFSEERRRRISISKKGKPSSSRSMTYKTACEIRAARESCGYSYDKLASMFKTSKGVVAHIIKNRSYTTKD